MDGRDLERSKEQLLKSVTRGNWWKVIELYREHPEIHETRISKSGDTAIHIAIANGLEPVVESLVSHLKEGKAALEIGNERGNTPLHLAASIGSLWMCKWIASRLSHHHLIGARNHEGKTPLFLAVSQGKIGAFLYLHHLSEHQQHGYYRTNSGDTILHSAISQEYFDIAFEIINLYPKLAFAVNEGGESPLHLLATKPSAFQSGSHITGALQLLVYHSIYVKKLAQVPYSEEYTVLSSSYPLNYVNCVYCFVFLRTFIRALVGSDRRNRNNQQTDAENQQYDLALAVGNNMRNRQQVEDAAHEELDQSIYETTHGKRRAPLGPFPPNYSTCIHIIRFVFSVFKLMIRVFNLVMMILGFGQGELKVKLEQEKEKHTWSVQVLNQLLEANSVYGHKPCGMRPEIVDNILPYPPSNFDKIKLHKIEDSFDIADQIIANTKMEIPLLIAAKNGVVEMVQGILDYYPGAVFEVNAEKKNTVMLAVEHRQRQMYKFLLKDLRIMRTLFGEVDEEGNSVLHIAANLVCRQPWHIRGAALQMHMEVKWYQFVKNSVPPGFFVRYNKRGETPEKIFEATHEELMEEGRRWLTDNSQSCSVVATLIATVAFTTSATVPGGVKQDSGTPTLENQPVFIVSAISSLIALCFSMISVVMFLGILTSSFQQTDFLKDLPRKLVVGLISLFVSIISMLVTFYAGHFFVLKDKLGNGAIAVYVVFCLPLIVFTIAQFPLNFASVWTALKKEP